jgi:hypothetical protein
LPRRDWNTTFGAADYVISSPVAEAEMDIKALQSQFLGDMILHPITQAREVLKFYRDFVVSGLPDELTALSDGGSPQNQ